MDRWTWYLCGFIVFYAVLMWWAIRHRPKNPAGPGDVAVGNRWVHRSCLEALKSSGQQPSPCCTWALWGTDEAGGTDPWIPDDPQFVLRPVKRHRLDPREEGLRLAREFAAQLPMGLSCTPPDNETLRRIANWLRRGNGEGSKA